MALSIKERLAVLDPAQRRDYLASLPEAVIAEMARGEWWYTARPEQVPPDGKVFIYLFMAGRGAGKSRSGSEWMVRRVLKHPFDRHGVPTEWLVVADTLSDARTINAEGPSGLLNILARRRIEHRYKQSPRPMVLMPNGSKIYLEGADSADTGRGYNAAGILCDEICIAENEPVLTDHGWLPIQNVSAGDRVMTRSGWRDVIHSALTQASAEIVEITTDRGSVHCTPDHRIWTQRGWIRAADVALTDTVIVCQPKMDLPPKRPRTRKLRRFVLGMTKPGITTNRQVTTTTVKGSFFIDAYGKRRGVRSPKATRSITSIVSDTITAWRTWSYLPLATIVALEPSNEMTQHGGRESPSVRPSALPLTGRCVSRSLSSATSAERRFTAQVCELSGARESAAGKPAYGQRQKVRSVEPRGQRPVYDLTVAGDAPEFFAGSGGILVHNCKWVRPYETWYEGLLPALRADLIDDQPSAFVTTTPKPIKLLVEWLARGDGGVHVITGSTFDNASNLSPSMLAELKRQYDGTALGEQELYGKLLELTEGGLFRRMDIAKNRVDTVPDGLVATAVGMDPNLTGEEALTGLVVMARTADNHLYVLADRTTQSSGRDAALAAWRAVAEFAADILVYEENLGKRYLREVLEDAYRECVELGMFPRNTTAPLKPVHAKFGKKTRAEPVAMRNEQGRLHFVGHHDELEDQCVLFDPVSTRESPDRLDAMVHAGIHLMAGERRRMGVSDPSRYDFRLDQSVYDLSRLL